MLTNELPRITYVSGALASRFVLLTLTQSFYDREDTELSEKLYAELLGIFNWSLEGLERLHHRSNGRSIRFGEWVERPDGTWALRIPISGDDTSH